MATLRIAAAETAVEHFVEGRRLMESGNFAAACREFEAAQKLDKDAPGVLLNLGACNEQQHKIATALRWYRQARVRAAEQSDTVSLAAAIDKIDRLQKLVTRLRLRPARPLPPATRVTIDGAPAPLDDIELDAGHHEIELAGGDVVTVHYDLDIDRERTISLALPVTAPPGPAHIVDAGASDRSHGVWLGAAGLGLLAASTGLAIEGKRRYDDATTAGDRSGRDRWRDIVRYGCTSMGVLGIAGLATGVVLYVRGTGKQHVETTVAVQAGEVVGLVVDRRF
jgi:hypothetical protein